MVRTILFALLAVLTLSFAVVQAASAQQMVFEEDFFGVSLGTRVNDPSLGWQVNYAFPNTRASITPVDPSRSPIWDLQDGNFIDNQPDGGDTPPTPPFVAPYPLFSYSMVTGYGQVEDYSVAAITPQLDLTGATGHLRYDLFSDGYDPAPNDYFEVWLSDDDGTTWQGPFNQRLAQQSTTPQTYSNEQLVLDAVSDSSEVRIAFVAHGDDIWAITAWVFSNIEVVELALEVHNQGTSQQVQDGGTDDIGSRLAGIAQTTTYRIENVNPIQVEIDAINVTSATNIDGGAGGVVANAPTGPINAGTSATFNVTFAPQAEAPFAVELEIDSPQFSAPFTFTIEGDGVVQSWIVIERPEGTEIPANDTIDLENISVNGVSLTFTLRNFGNDTLELTGTEPVSATVVTNGTAEVTSQPSLTVAAGATTTFSVAFDPEEIGALEASINVSSNAPNEPNYTINIVANATVPLGSGGGSGGGCGHILGGADAAQAWLVGLLLFVLVAAGLRRRK